MKEHAETIMKKVLLGFFLLLIAMALFLAKAEGEKSEQDNVGKAFHNDIKGETK